MQPLTKPHNFYKRELITIITLTVILLVILLTLTLQQPNFFLIVAIVLCISLLAALIDITDKLGKLAKQDIGFDIQDIGFDIPDEPSTAYPLDTQGEISIPHVLATQDETSIPHVLDNIEQQPPLSQAQEVHEGALGEG